MKHEIAGYMFPFACFHCRRSFKRKYRPRVRELACPRCGGVAVRMSRKFRPPAAGAIHQWKMVVLLYTSGFRFDSLHDTEDAGKTIPYPRSLKEAREFIARYGWRVRGRRRG